MALHELLEALREEAAVQRAEILARAADEALRIRSAAASETTRRRNEFMARVTSEAEAGERRTMSRKRAGAVEDVLVARSRVLERLRAAVEARIALAEQDGGYNASLAAELRAALDRMPPGPMVLLASPGIVAPLSEAVRELDTAVSVEAAPQIGPGFVLRSGDGRVEVDATLKTRLEYAWPRLAAAALQEMRT